MPDLPAAPRLIAARPVQPRGSRIARALLHLAGWELEFDGLPARQGVLTIYPHTSNWDFLVGICAKWAMGIQVTWWGKDSLFRVPLLGRWMRWLGGVAVDRSAPGGIVGEMVQRMRSAREADRFCWLALAPEGTRASSEGWRSGFHRVAAGADIPLALGYFDYRRKRVGVCACLRLSGRVQADMAAIAQQLAQARGYRPALAAPIRIV